MKTESAFCAFASDSILSLCATLARHRGYAALTKTNETREIARLCFCNLNRLKGRTTEGLMPPGFSTEPVDKTVGNAVDFS
ncbi:MAG: hypothetical protein WBS54_00755 [Acidobacteriota bacterium]